MPLNINITPTAKAELWQLTSYLHIHASAKVAENFVETAQKTLNDLSIMPELGSEIPVRRVFLSGMRCMPLKKPFKKYLIFYRIIDMNLEVVHILHGARDIDTVINE